MIIKIGSMTFSIMTLTRGQGTTTLSIMTISMMALCIMTLCIMIHSTMVLGIMTLSIIERIVTLNIKDIQLNATQHKH